MKYVKIAILFAVLFLSISFAYASDNSVNETLDLTKSDETSIDSTENVEPVQQTENISDNDVLGASAQSADSKKVNKVASNSTKKDLKIVKSSNFVKTEKHMQKLLIPMANLELQPRQPQLQGH